MRGRKEPKKGRRKRRTRKTRRTTTTKSKFTRSIFLTVRSINRNSGGIVYFRILKGYHL